MTVWSDLSDRLETETGPDEELNVQLWKMTSPNHYRSWASAQKVMFSKDWNKERREAVLEANAQRAAKHYTSSLDAALGLVPPNTDVHTLIRETQNRLSRRFALHMQFWPSDIEYLPTLARYIAAAAMRLREEDTC